MSRDFETIEDYVDYVTSVSEKFVKKQLHSFITSRIMIQAREYVYNPSKFFPKVYVWTNTMVDWNYYSTELSRPSVSISEQSIDAYTYSLSPHVHSVVNGEPYEYPFKYNGEGRPFVEVADKKIQRNDLGKINNRLRAFYSHNGLEAY